MVTHILSKLERSNETADHLESVDDGCGCTEIWEHLSEHRDDDESLDETSPLGDGHEKTQTDD